MSVDPSTAPPRPAYVRGADGLYYKIGGGGGGGGLDQTTADNRYVNVTGDTITGPIIFSNTSRLVTPLTINRTDAAQTTNDNDTFVVNYLTKRATWTNEKGNLRTSNEASPAEDAFKIIGAPSITGNHMIIMNSAGTSLARVGPAGTLILDYGFRLTPGASSGKVLTSDASGNGTWQTATGGGGTVAGPAPGLIYIDDMAGANDDAKLDAAIAEAKSYVTVKPAIAFGARRYDFSTASRQVYSGMKLIGLAGQGSQQRAANSIPNDIRFNGTGTWWVVPAGQTFDVHMSGLCFQGNANAQFMSSNPGVLWTSVFEDLGFNQWKHVFGNPTDITNTKFLNTACKWMGYFNFNNGYGTMGVFGGSDSDFFLDGGLIDSPPGNMPADQYHLIFNYQEKSGVGPIYNTCERASGVRIDGGATTSGLVLFGMARCEGRNIGQPCHGSNIRINGGTNTIRDWWVAYGASALNTNGHTGEGGIITQTGGDTLYDGIWYDRATGVAESVPFIYVSGGTARVRNIRTGTKGGSWSGKPIVARTGSGVVSADDTVTVTGDVGPNTATLVTSSLAANASQSTTIMMSKGYRLTRVSCSVPTGEVSARVRLYDTTTHRDADASRAAGTLPAGDHGLVLEFFATAALPAQSITPTVDGFDGAASPTGNIPIIVTNTGASATTITVTLQWIREQ